MSNVGTVNQRLLPLVVSLGLALLAGGCGAPGGPVRPPALAFPPTAFETVVSSSGRLRMEVRWSPAIPAKGDNAVQLTFLDEGGAAVDGLMGDVLPWMPAHGHGTSVDPVTTAAGPGVVVATPVYLYMSGEWQLRVTLTGSLDDSAVATTQIP
jgi:hypothetical protein